MLTKRIYVILYIGFIIVFCSCTSQKNTQRQFIRYIYDCPVSSLLKDGKAIYYTENGEKIIANVGGVEFDGGKDSLSAYLLSKYINHPNYNHTEYNVYEHFLILFDEHLDIKEVRIMHRKYADNERFYYDNIFIEALKSTTGMWHKTVEGKKWYYYLHRQWIY